MLRLNIFYRFSMVDINRVQLYLALYINKLDILNDYL